MKPTKNKVMCFDCGRNKMLFETEKKALNFIKFNADDIEDNSGKRPIRAYYCDSCCGWHVTSSSETSKRKITRTNRVIGLYHKAKENEKIMNENYIENTIKQIEDRKFQYIGLFLTEDSQNNLKEKFSDIIPLEAKMYLHHCTLLHVSNMKHPNADKVIETFIKALKSSNTTETIQIIEVGSSERAMAFKCVLNTPCCNNIPHITICTFNGGKPVESNYIKNWLPLDKPIKVKVEWGIR